LGVSRDTLGVASNYDGLFFKLYDEVGSVAFWFDVDDRGTSAPSHGCDRAVEINTVTNGMTNIQAGTAIYNKIVADAKFEAGADAGTGTITVQSSTAGNKTDASSETSPCTVSVDTQGRTDNYHELYFVLYDEAGSVGVWFDVNDAGGAAPAGALLCTRQLEIETITTAMTAGQAGTAIYNKIIGDAKFEAGSDDTAGTIIVSSSTYGIKADATQESSPLTISVVQDGVDSNYDGMFFKLYDSAGSVAFWFDVDNSGTAAPVHGCSRAVEITTVTSAMAVGALGTAVYNAIIGDSEFEAGDDDTAGTIKVQCADAGVKIDADAGTSPCAVSVDTQGADNYNGLYFKLYDDAGSVGFWFDIDDSGTAEPAEATACARAVEIKTVLTGMDAPTAATAIYNAIIADAGFDANVDNGDGTFKVTAFKSGERTDGDMGTSDCDISVSVDGITSNYDGAYMILGDSAGSIGVWVDVDDAGTAEPTVVGLCDRAIEITTINSGMTAQEAMDEIMSALVSDGVLDVTDCGGASAILESDDVGASDQEPSFMPNVFEVTTIVSGKDNGGSLSDDAKKALKNSLAVNKNNRYYLELVRVIEAGSGTSFGATLAVKCKKLLDIMLCDRACYREIIALYA
jgi:hypothetical protein